MASSEIEERWQGHYERLAGEMSQWRKEHPRATFNEIEAEVDKRMNRLRATMLADIAAANDIMVEEKPGCPQCGKRARLRGKKRRRRPAWVFGNFLTKTYVLRNLTGRSAFLPR